MTTRDLDAWLSQIMQKSENSFAQEIETLPEKEKRCSANDCPVAGARRALEPPGIQSRS
jgi:hypothetical protein